MGCSPMGEKESDKDERVSDGAVIGETWDNGEMSKQRKKDGRGCQTQH